MGKINTWDDCISCDEQPKKLQDGLKLLADWFDAVYQDQGKNDSVQQDLRKWASEIDTIYHENKQLKIALTRISAWGCNGQCIELIKTHCPCCIATQTLKDLE